MNLISECLLRLFLAFSLLISTSVIAADGSLPADGSLRADGSLVNQSMWKSLSDQTQLNIGVAGKSTSSALTARLLELDEIGFKSLLIQSSAKADGSVASKIINSNSETINLPMPDGSQIEVNITPSKVMTDVLSQQFPDIKTWKVTGVSQDISGVMDFTHHGFHGMLLMPDGDRVFIQPDEEIFADKELSAQGRYISFSKKQNKASFKSEFSCGTHGDAILPKAVSAKGLGVLERLSARSAPTLITYRLAVAATGEFTQANGGSKASALSSIATIINRVNEIYERDLGIVFKLVDEQSDIIYLNPNTDPYNSSNIDLILNQNNQNLSSNGDLSKDKYDVGHVFGSGNFNGGLAYVGGVCDDDFKALGGTGLTRPYGDAFALDYVAHELGHQLGGSHTFNSACNGGGERTALTAVEPGSGTTIMAYPGICEPNNLQNSVDPQFHVVSIDQITAVTRDGGGGNCGIDSTSNNQNPTVNAGADKTIPARTPLALRATGADADNDNLSYVWEQTDAGATSNVNVDTGNNALFRSRPISSDNIRFIPTLNDLFARTVTPGEVLPVTNREINMAATVRDGKGGLEFDRVKFDVFDTGEQFRVTSHSNNQVVGSGDVLDVRWNVAGTNVSPISCTNVDIGIGTANGEGIDITTTANNGRAEVIIPNNAPDMNDARIIVSCSNNVFFNISAGRLTIGEGGQATGSSGGGGSFGFFIMLFGSLLVCFRRCISLIDRAESNV